MGHYPKWVITPYGTLYFFIFLYFYIIYILLGVELDVKVGIREVSGGPNNKPLKML